jgi:hypothetical protein
MGHQRRFKRKQRTSAYPPIPDILLRRTALPPRSRRMAATFAKLPDLLQR